MTMTFDPVDVVMCRVTTLSYITIAIHVHRCIHDIQDQSLDS